MSRLDPIVAAVKSHIHTIGSRQPPSADQPRLFITISREAGAGGRTLMHRLVEKLNEIDPPGPDQTPWTGFDRELVEKVARDHNLHTALVDMLEEQCHSWLYDVFAGLTSQTTETQVFRRVAETIRGLAQGGRVVIVGRGGVFITRNMPGGIHIQLVAPYDYRVEQMAKQLGGDTQRAAEEVTRIDENRQMFYKRYWPDTPVTPSLFTVTYNSADLSEEQMVGATLALIQDLERSRVVKSADDAQHAKTG